MNIFPAEPNVFAIVICDTSDEVGMKEKLKETIDKIQINPQTQIAKLIEVRISYKTINTR